MATENTTVQAHQRDIEIGLSNIITTILIRDLAAARAEIDELKAKLASKEESKKPDSK